MNAVLYDFKRAFIRPATLIALAVFVLVGVGLSYLVSIALSTSPQYIVSQGMGELDTGSGRLSLYIYVTDAELKPVNVKVDLELMVVNASMLKVEEFSTALVKKASFEANGFLNASVTLDASELAYFKQLLNESGMLPYLSVTVSTPIGSRYYSSPLTASPELPDVLYWCLPCQYFRSQDYTKVLPASIQAYRVNGEYIIVAIFDLPSSGFKLRYAFSPDLPPALENYTIAGPVSTGLNVFKAGSVNASNIIAYFALEDSNGSIYLNEGGPVVRVYSGRMQRAVTSQVIGSAGLGLFSSFFPIVVLYLAYALIAKPKGIGALEFLIARPVTRWDVYFTRFAAGVLTAVASAAVFLVSLNIANLALIGYSLEVGDAVTLFLGLAGSLVAFYSLCYMFSTILSGGRYLAVSIFLYLFFTMIMGILVFIIAYLTYGFGPGLASKLMELQYTAYYLNPLGLVSFATYFVNKGLGIEGFTEVSVVNPYLVVAAGIAWTFIPFILGWFLFRRANLSR